MHTLQIIGLAAEIVAVALIGILLDRYLGNLAAGVGLCVCLIFLGWLHWDEIKPLMAKHSAPNIRTIPEPPPTKPPSTLPPSAPPSLTPGRSMPKLPAPIPFHEGVPTMGVVYLGPFHIANRWDWSLLKKKHVSPVTLGGRGPFELYVKGDVLYVDAIITDEKGEVKMTIKESEFIGELPPGWDLNYTDSELEIVDALMRPVFRQTRINRSETDLCGNFYGPPSDGSKGFFSCGAAEFKYPSRDNLGKKR